METAKPHLFVYDEQNKLKDILDEFSGIFNFDFSYEKNLEKLQNSGEGAVLILVEEGGVEPFYSFLAQIAAKKCRVIYFGQKSIDAHSFKKLKEELFVHYVLQQPIDRNEVAAVLRNIFSKADRAEETPAYLTPELLVKYREKIYEKIERIEDLIKKTASVPNFKDNLLEIRNEVHKISGNAAPYGYPDAGKLCSMHEIFLYNLYSGNTTRELPEIVLQNELFLRKLKLYFQKIVPRQPQTTASLEQTEAVWQRRVSDEKPEGIFIHLLTPNFDLARYFQAAAAKKHISIEIGDDPEAYLKQYNTLTRLPKIILVDEHFPFTKWSGIALIKELASRQPKKESQFGIMTDWDNLDKRLEWMKEGVDLIVKKPITEASVDYILNHALKSQRLERSRVLIVDDDEEQGLLMKNILESHGIATKYLQDESQLFIALQEFAPNLLLLDIQLPKYSGQLLLNALREDIRFKNLLIVIVTALPAREIDAWAYHAACDSVLHKPIDPSIFLARIGGLLERQREFLKPQEVDPLTGIYTWDHFQQRVESFLTQCPKETKCALVLLKIARWRELTSVLNINEAQLILLTFSELLKSHFFSALFQGVIVQGSFAFLFKDLSGGEIEIMVESFNEKIRSKVWLSSQPQLTLHINSSSVLFMAGDVGLQRILIEAKEALVVAEKERVVRAETRRLGDRVALPKRGKRIIMIDDDKDLCEIVQFAFEKQGYQFKVFHTAMEALHYFAQLPQIEGNSLIILDRRLPDGDGIDILRRIQDKFPGGIKAIFLSSLANEQEILEALRLGALDYITKPFSIEVLIEKAAILINK